jgi:(p)ppGpp synthase/HD superfamily hydrolase
MTTESIIVERALVFASAAHAAVGQKRKYTGEDYIVHPVEVADIVRSVPHTEAMVAAALLHDTVEDTAVTLELIRGMFSDEVAELVYWLTDISINVVGNRAFRKELDRKHMGNAPAEAQTVKVADLISNGRSIFKHDPAFAKTYLQEKSLLLAMLTKADATLLKIASDLCMDYVLDKK